MLINNQTTTFYFFFKPFHNLLAALSSFQVKLGLSIIYSGGNKDDHFSQVVPPLGGPEQGAQYRDITQQGEFINIFTQPAVEQSGQNQRLTVAHADIGTGLACIESRNSVDSLSEIRSTYFCNNCGQDIVLIINDRFNLQDDTKLLEFDIGAGKTRCHDGDLPAHQKFSLAATARAQFGIGQDNSVPCSGQQIDGRKDLGGDPESAKCTPDIGR